MDILGYTIRDNIHRGNHFSVFRAVNESRGTTCILKVLDKKAAAARSVNVQKGLEREYRFLKRIDSPYVIRVVDWLDCKDYSAVVMEDTRGVSLKEKLAGKPLPVDQFLAVAIAITSGISVVHGHNIIHKDINPANIILDSRAVQPGVNLKIIDFNIASGFDVKVSYLGNPERLEGTLPYISPEQTGRMNRKVDTRSDLYSLGVTFYQLLTGQLPFQRQTPLEMVYDHMARDPKPPYFINDDVPVKLSRIVMKLMAKNPVERYQTAAGVRHDLEMYRDHKAIDFPLGERDFSGKLQVPEKLYGREKEVKLLLDAYQGAREGVKELVMISGYSGTGKSALVNEIHKPVSRDSGYFISGKFDRLQRSVPYYAFIQAFDQFCQLLLTENQDLLDHWKTVIKNAVGKLGNVLTGIIPRLPSIIGEQPPAPPMGGREAKKRFHYIFLRFIQAVSSADRPLVMFIDDLQWADLASLDLLQLIMEDKQNRHLFVIGAYRDNEVSDTHPLVNTLERLREAGIPVKTIPVGNLSNDDLSRWFSDTLNVTGDSIAGEALQPLSRLVYEKTQGNAFFTIRFLENLYQNGLLYFDFPDSRWAWDILEIKRQNITENVVDLLVQKIRTLPVETQDVLKMAACVGHRFTLSTLNVLFPKQGGEDLERYLDTAQAEHLVYIADKETFTYKFVHDRIHHAAYSLIPQDHKKELHLSLGRFLLENADYEDIIIEAPGRLYAEEHRQLSFDIVNHLNIGLGLIVEQPEKLRLARLNLAAAHNAKISAAYGLAGEYINTARQLLPGDGWEQHYSLVTAVHNEALQIAYLRGKLDRMEMFIETLLSNARDISHTAVAYEHRLMGLIAQGKAKQALETLLAIFKRLGIHIPKKTGKSQTAAVLAETRALLEERGIDALKNLPPMNDPGKRLAVRLFYVGTGAFAYAAQDVVIYATAKIVCMILQYGLTPEAPFVISGYGTKKVYLGNIPAAYRLGEAAVDLMEQGIGDAAVKHRTMLSTYVYLLGNKQHYKEIARLMNDTYLLALESGDIELVGYVLTNYVLCLTRTGTPLSKVYKKAMAIRDKIIELNQHILVTTLMSEFSATSALLGEDPAPAILDAAGLKKLFPAMPPGTPQIFTWQVNTKKVFLAFLFEIIDPIYDLIQKAEEDWKHLTSHITFIKSDYYFYITLAYLQLCGPEQDANARKKYLNKVRKNIKIMKEWAELGPVNFLHKYYLMQAEYYRVTGKIAKAAELYDNAIEKAFENDYINEAAIANELAAKFYIQSNQPKFAGIYLTDARNCYQQWGAAAKVRHLEEHYPKYLSVSIPGLRQSFGDVTLATSDSSTGFLDVKSILKASQTLSGEVHLKKLLESMVHILVENAGAQKCLFIQDIDGRLSIQAEGNTEGVSSILHELPVESSGKLPLSVINYVARSKQTLVFENLSNSTEYAADRYVQTHQPKSAVCFPVLQKNQLSAIIYLENNGIEGVFTPSRLEVLNMLSSQIAISVENTQLYEQLEEKVKQRTVALQKAHEELEIKHGELEISHKNINDSVYYASRIQEAVLPSLEIFDKLLPEYFIMYRPCSVIGGDFYWIKKVQDKIIVTAADCTGHGVPGALVSMLGMAFLNDITSQLAAQSRLQANVILDELRKRVKTALKQKAGRSVQKEGMDIALCIIDPAARKIQYAGAYNSLVLVRDHQLMEIKADRMPIGIYRNERPFTGHDLDYKDGEMLYLFSDGYADQNNDIDDAKFTKKAFKRLLVKHSLEPVAKQEEILNRTFDEWKGNQPQRDDVLVMGIRL